MTFIRLSIALTLGLLFGSLMNQGQAPDRRSVVQAVMIAHPEINSCDEVARGAIVDYAAQRLNSGNRGPWGRKSRNKPDGDHAINPNSDGLTFLRPDNKFEIIDVLSGAPPCGVTWDTDGHAFNQGENGWWTPPQLGIEVIPGSTPVPPVTPDPSFTTLLQELANLRGDLVALKNQVNQIEGRPLLTPAQVQEIIDETVANLIVSGSTGRALGHVHSVNIKVMKQ